VPRYLRPSDERQESERALAASKDRVYAVEGRGGDAWRSAQHAGSAHSPARDRQSRVRPPRAPSV